MIGKGLKAKFQFNRDNVIISRILLAAALVTAGTVLATKCNEVKAAIQNELVVPVVKEECKKVIEPIVKNQDLTSSNVEILIEMVKDMSPDGEECYKRAKDKIDNIGKFPENK